MTKGWVFGFSGAGWRHLSLSLIASAALFLPGLPGSFAQEKSQDPQATIFVDASRPEGRISPLLFGTNISYPGMVNGFDNWIKTQGDYEQAIDRWFGYLPLVDRLGPTILRFPGGLNANEYVWNFGIGPMQDRVQQSFGGNGFSVVGTDEFLLLCEELQAEAMITVNVNRASGKVPLTQGQAVENFERNSDIAADWVEYCNAPHDGSNPRGGADWAAVRAKNGHEEPYGVKYWELGNELFDMPLDWYKKAAVIFSKKMKSVDPTLLVGAVAQQEIRPREEVEKWFREILSEAKPNVDFWITHPYTPAASGKVNGFMLAGPGASISTKIEMPARGSCSLCFNAEPFRGIARVGVYLDGKRVDGFTVLPRKEYCANVRGTPGEHLLGIQLEGGNLVYIHHMAKKEDGSADSYLDLKNSPELYYLIVSGASLSEAKWLHGNLLGGKPLYVTEYNCSYELAVRPPMLGQISALREALNVSQYLQLFTRLGLTVATQWMLYDDLYGFGLIEGVGLDRNHGDQIGRKDPRPRPQYYVLKLYRENLEGDRLPVEVRSPKYHIGPPAPHVGMGFVGTEPMDLPYVNAVASLSEGKRRLSLLVNNLHYDKPSLCKVRLNGFVPGREAEHRIVTGENSWTNNEPESCPQGDCVTLREVKLSVPGPEFTCTLPPHSVSAIVLHQEGVVEKTPAPPGQLRAEGSAGIVRLSWTKPAGSGPHAYHVYRSRLANGPFRNRVSVVPGDRTAFEDHPRDKGIRYVYAVRSVNDLGEESDFSNRASASF